MAPKVVSLFAGIGGFDLGLERAGFEVVRQVEIDHFCLRVLEKHWPLVDRGTDIRKEVPETYAERYGTIDLICGGFPCQDLSVAGKRAGLAGERSGLFYELLRVADSNPASWVLAENVPGLLSSAGGADFATVLGELSGFFPEVPTDGWRNSGVCSGPKGTVAWRVLDAQYFGVAQRRRRVFIVRSPATARGSAFEVLFEPDCVSGDPPPSREKGQRLARTLTEGFGSRGVDADQTANGNYAIGDEVSLCLKASGNFKQDTTHETYIVASTLRSGGDRVAGWVDREDRIFAYQSDEKRSTAQELIFHKPQGKADSLTQQKQNVISQGVHRLTPTECERLQGFPDGWTLLGDKTPDSPRYKACGNAVCVNVAEWIGKHLKAVMGKEESPC